MLLNRMRQIGTRQFAAVFIALTAISFNVSASLSPAMAQGVPTIDGQNTLQTIKQLEAMLRDAGIQTDMLANMRSQLSQLEQQYSQLQDIYGQFSGVRDIADLAMGDGLDGLLDGNLTNILGTIQAGMNGDWSGFNDGKAGKLTESVQTTLSAAGLSQEGVSQMASSGVPGAERTAASASSGAVLAATAQQTYEEAGSSLDRINRIVEMSQSSEDIKESIDWNTRMLADMSVLLIKSLELQAIEAVYSGQAGVLDAATHAEERAFLTFSND